MPDATESQRAMDTDDSNRIIAIVTGANSGFGLGICQALLSNLSVCGDTPVPCAVPTESSLPPALAPLLSEEGAAAARTAARMPSPHPTLTLILACRSEKNATQARTTILDAHYAELAARRKRGIPIPDGWTEGLRVEFEPVDLDAVGGPNGILAFTRRVASKYPHVTSLFLNAGYAAFKQVVIPAFMWQIITDGYLHALHHPRYNIEEVGARSADGERGRVWGVNVLSPYIMAKELAPMLRASPKTLPIEPRVVYTSSIEAEAEALHVTPLNDYQLLAYDTSYRASKYMGDLVVAQLDKELGGEENARPIRCISAEPGCVATNIAVAGLGAWKWLVKIKWICYWLSFYIANLLGSPHHPVWATYGAVPMLYAAFIADTFLLPAAKQPPKVHVVSHRFRPPTVKYGEVDQWEKHQGIAEGLAERCEAIRSEWATREKSL